MAIDFKKRWKFWVLGILIVLILGVAIAGFLKFKPIQPTSNETGKKAYVDPKIYNQFNNETDWVWIDVRVNSTAINFEELIKSLESSKGIKYIDPYKAGSSFTAMITKEGLEELKNNRYILRIYLNLPARPTLN